METTTQNPSDNLNQEVAQTVNETAASAEQLAAGVQDVVIDASNPLHPEHPEHHKHMSALRAAGIAHSAVGHVMPHHKGIDL